ncbi:unnamed protein product, partial [Oppiella nova]
MSVTLSPDKRVIVSIKPYNHEKSPKICLSMDSCDETSDGVNIRKSCHSCHELRQMVAFKDMAIRRLSEDREELKLKLTQIHNKNIDLKQTLKRLETQDIGSDVTQSHEKFNELKASNEELVAINRHLRQHLNTLRQVFTELYNSGEDTTVTTTNTSSDTTVQSVTKTPTKTQSTSTDFIATTDKS